MDLLPTSLGTRPRLAVEMRVEGVVAARTEDAEAEVAALKQRVAQLSAHPISESAQLARLIKAVDACLASSSEKAA